MFDQDFFQALEGHVHSYFSEYPALNGVNVVVRTSDGEALRCLRVVEAAKSYVVLSLHDLERSTPRSEDEADLVPPFVFLPYECIVEVCIDPSAKRGIGFEFTP